MAGQAAQETGWIEIIIPVFEGTGDEIAARLALDVPAAAAGVIVGDTHLTIWVSEAGKESALADVRAVYERMKSDQSVPDAQVTTQNGAPESEWRDAWKRYFKTTRITRQLVIVPSWDSFEAGPDDHRLELDPGQAFGTGDHASTRLVLQFCQELADAGHSYEQVLDVGTGSGILALACARLWPSSTGIGLDNDPLAVRCAQENFEQNHVSKRFRASETPLATITGRFPLVLANIQADVLIPMAETLLAKTAPGGTVCLSGILTEQMASVHAAYESLGTTTVKTLADSKKPEWSATLLRAPE